MALKNPPEGGNARFLVLGDSRPFASFDTRAEAEAYKAMQLSKKKGDARGASAQPAKAATMTWVVQDRGF